MTDKQKIKEEIERLRDIDEETLHLNKESFNSGRWKALTQIKAFIDSLPEEHVSEDLEDAAYHFCLDEFGNPKESLFKFDQRCFIAGAEWQKQQIMKDAVECTVHQCEVDGIKLDGVEILSDGLMLDDSKYKVGDKVKVIVVKTE